MDLTCASLLERLRQPADAEAWEHFVELYTPVLFAWSRGMGLQDADASDLVQDVLAGLVRSMPGFTFDPNRSFRAWLRTVLVNQWRASRRKKAVRLGAGGPIDLENVPAETEAFGEAEYRKHVAARALTLIRNEFQPSTWQAFWLSVVEGLTAEETGTRLGLSAGAVRMAKLRVTNRLRQELHGLLD
jgi:RNA polymerase sigma-70 factor (ECF subfamily)